MNSAATYTAVVQIHSWCVTPYPPWVIATLPSPGPPIYKTNASW